VRPSAHIFVDSKAPWFEITDGLPQFSEFGDGELSNPVLQADEHLGRFAPSVVRR
jgi:hypothetical protein